MSLFGAMNTAISGLTAQSSAFGNISDDVANSQTVGFKRVDTNFEDYLTQSTSSTNLPGAVVASPDYVNNVQGTITQSDNSLALAISGQGFFAVSESNGASSSASSNAQPSFSSEQYYTRDGNFQMDKNGYLVNDAGEYLNGWSVDPTTGNVDQNTLAPIQVNQSSDSPVATTDVELSANLPATPTTGTGTAASPITSQVNIYDAEGTEHALNLSWVQNSSGDWTVSVSSPDDTSGQATPTAELYFGDNGTAAGTPGNLVARSPTATVSSYAADTPATMSFAMNFGDGAQNITLGLGTYGEDNGVTQFAGTQYSLGGLTQNGVPPGAFSSVSTNDNGDIIVNYNNGQSRTIAQVPLVTFNAPDQLQRQNGQAFTETVASGTPIANQAGNSGAGTLVTSSVEGSNVDIATEFSQLIVAQQAYSANTKVVTTADTMLQATLNMIS